jgi:hypothetical protein
MTEIAAASTAQSNQTPPSPAPAERWADRGAPASAPPSRPGAITSEAFHRLAPDVQTGFVNLRGGEWIERSKLEAPADPPKSADQATAKPGDTATATVTEDGRLKVGELLLDAKDIQQIMTETAAREARKATMPATAAEYSLDLPADFVMPEGQNWKWATDHPVLGPLIGQAKEFAFASGIDQPAFSKMMSLFAASQIHEAQMIAKAQAAEREKLGPMIAHRVDAVTNFIRGSVGDDKIAKAMTQRILTADDVVGWEKIIRKASSQGAASFRQDGREPANNGRGPLSSMSDAEYSALSASEKFAIAKRG